MEKSYEEERNIIRKFIFDLLSGKSISDILSFLSLQEIQSLESIESQVAMLLVIEKVGLAPLVQDTIVDELKHNAVKFGFFNTIGSKALVRCLQHCKTISNSILKSLSLDLFSQEKTKDKVTQILNISIFLNSKVFSSIGVFFYSKCFFFILCYINVICASNPLIIGLDVR